MLQDEETADATLSIIASINPLFKTYQRSVADSLSRIFDNYESIFDNVPIIN